MCQGLGEPEMLIALAGRVAARECDLRCQSAPASSRRDTGEGLGGAPFGGPLRGGPGLGGGCPGLESFETLDIGPQLRLGGVMYQDIGDSSASGHR